MVNLFIRITRPYDVVKEWVAKISTVSQAVIVYEHTGDKGKRVHIHLYVEECSVSTETLKRWISKGPADVFFKTDWSFKEKYLNKSVDRNCITYMSKGNIEPSYVFGMTTQEIYDLKTKWINYNEHKPCSNDSKNAKSDKPTQHQMVCEMVELIQQNNVDIMCLGSMFRAIGTVLRKYSVVTSIYKIRDYYDTIRLRLEHYSIEEDFMTLVNRSYRYEGNFSKR